MLIESFAGVPCRILSASDPSPRTLHADLARHFADVGTPVMVGGDGGGARTIVGVEISHAGPLTGGTGDAKAGAGAGAGAGVRIASFLVVDPHYCGADSVAAMAANAAGRACCWADPVALTRQYCSFTNFCLPLPSPPSVSHGGGGSRISGTGGIGYINEMRSSKQQINLISGIAN